MSNAIIKQGASSVVADNIWDLRLGAGPLLLGLALGSTVTAMVLSRLRRPAAATPTPRGWPVTFAHRGGAKVVPEDTVEGFREAIALAGDLVVELDVHTSADGVVVVIHDADVGRTTNGSGPVAEKVLAELQQLDAAYHFTPDDRLTYPWRGRGVTIPTLEHMYAEFGDRPFNIEIKGRRPGIEQAVWQVIETAGAAGTTLVVSDDRATIRRFRRICRGRVATAASTVELLVFWLAHLARLGPLLDPPYQALQPPEKYRGLRIVTPRLVREAHARDLRVDVWTIDDEPAMRRLLSYGVDGIMTDRPDVLAGVLAGT